MSPWGPLKPSTEHQEVTARAAGAGANTSLLTFFLEAGDAQELSMRSGCPGASRALTSALRPALPGSTCPCPPGTLVLSSFYPIQETARE